LLAPIVTIKNDAGMLTDRKPRKADLLDDFIKSDKERTLDLPQDERLRALSTSIEAALTAGKRSTLQQACARFLEAAADFYDVTVTPVRILAARPLRSREGGWATELFGDYDPQKKVIRVWMRTAIRKQVTSYGTFLSTLCHEFCHHLDYERYRYRDSWHTRGFYERAAVLYHHVRGTPTKRLFWIATPGGRWRIDWPRTNRGG